MGLVDARHLAELKVLHQLRRSIGLVSVDAHHFVLSSFELDVE
jgi:hypothetical protein